MLILICGIPIGTFATYGQIATLSGNSNHARAVGQLLKSLPEGSKVPWHRVINSKGSISFPKLSPRYKKQQYLLEQEGVIFKGDKINLTKYKWD